MTPFVTAIRLTIVSWTTLGMACDHPTPTQLGSCSDEQVNQDETDVDCGGSVCKPCGLGQRCSVEPDCAAPTACGADRICNCIPELDLNVAAGAAKQHCADFWAGVCARAFDDCGDVLQPTAGSEAECTSSLVASECNGDWSDTALAPAPAAECLAVVETAACEAFTRPLPVSCGYASVFPIPPSPDNCLEVVEGTYREWLRADAAAQITGKPAVTMCTCVGAGASIDVSTADGSATSTVDDTLLFLYGPQGYLVAYDDDSGDALYSKISAVAPAAGPYLIVVTSRLGKRDVGEIELSIHVVGGEPCDAQGMCDGGLICGPLGTCVDGCYDGVVDRDETDIDCGGSICDPCGIGSHCQSNDDCQGGLLCGPAHICIDGCADDVLNQDESDVDCGGTICAACLAGQACRDVSDCHFGLECTGYVCADSCDDGIQNGDETDVDCGGLTCPRCLPGEACQDSDDCELGLVCHADVCADLCADGTKNQDESDVDCGGSLCGRCGEGATCQRDADCFTQLCSSNSCTLGSGPLSAVELCAVYTNYWSEENSNLCFAGGIRTGLALAPDTLAWICRPGSEGRVWGEALLAAVDSGSVMVDWMVARQCLATSRTLREKGPAYLLAKGITWENLANGPCTQFVAGMVGLGQRCESEWDCASGLGCFTDDLFAPSLTCMEPAAQGEACSVYKGCADGLVCNDDSAGTCVPLAAPGESCSEDADCASQTCDVVLGECVPPPTTALGQPCSEARQCLGACVTCRPLSAGGQTTCELYGGEGDYCRGWHDCLIDLGCVDNVCTAVGRNRGCAGPTQAVCRAGYDCIAPFDCSQLSDASACVSQSQSTCDWQDGTCRPVEGICLEVPASGPCALDQFCAPESYCNASLECVPRGTDAASCTEDAQCREDLGYFCQSGQCRRPECAMHEDCGAGQYCESTTGQCHDLATTGCTNNEECGEDKACLTPDEYCSRFDSDSTSCDAVSECQSSVLCVSECWQYDLDPTECAAQIACAFDPLSGRCDPADPSFDCSVYGDDLRACAAAAGCTDMMACQATDPIDPSACFALRAVGESCSSYLDGQDCESLVCQPDALDRWRCAVRPTESCLNRTIDFVRAAFLFGGVWIIGVGRHRRRRQ